MDRIEDVFVPVRRILETHLVYTVVDLALGFSVHRWNANRVGHMEPPPRRAAEACI